MDHSNLPPDQTGEPIFKAMLFGRFTRWWQIVIMTRAQGRFQRVVICSSISFPMFERIWFSYHTGSNRKYSCKMR